MTREPTPANSLPSEDVGAETGYRFGYQDAWAATLACALIDEPAEFTELFCEHHEDILLKQVDGKFQGIQVKTRQLTGAPWKADDDGVFKSLCRFVLLDAQFPNQFAKFVFATNHFFFETSASGNNLPHVLAEAVKAVDLASAPTIVKRLADNLAKTTKRGTEEVLSTLKKTNCTADLPKLNDSRKVLRESIIRAYPPAQDAVFHVLTKAANQLVAAVRAASSLEHLDSLPAYLCLLNDAEAIEARRRIEAKLFTPERLRKVLQESLSTSSLLGHVAPEVAVPPGEARNRLERKLEAGGLSVVSINLATDLSASALHRFLEWCERFGEKEALRRYHHLKTLVLKDCASAHEDTKRDQERFGRKMLESLRARLVARTQAGSAAVFDCREEHLEGCAYELTSACKVWWSEPFDLNEG